MKHDCTRRRIAASCRDGRIFDCAERVAEHGHEPFALTLMGANFVAQIAAAAHLWFGCWEASCTRGHTDPGWQAPHRQ